MCRVVAWFSAQERVVKLALLVALLPRLWFAFGDHSVFWPDEIYQSIEPAHRLAFGYGLLPWEFRDGARSWIYPVFLAVPLKLLGLLGVHSALGFVVAARLVMVALAVWGTAIGVEYARRVGGKGAALIAAWTLALFPPLLVYSHRTMQEAASTPLVLIVPLLLLSRTKQRAMWAGLAIGCATLLRFQCAIIAGVFFIALVLEQRWDELKAYTKAGLIVAVAGGVLDWITWGRPFHSFITYVDFNLIHGGASTFGVSPPAYYLRTLWTSSGPTVLLVGVGLVLAGVRRARAATAAVVAFLLLHSAIPHKEFRFVLPVLPLLMSVGAIGLAQILERWKNAALAPAVLAAVISLGFLKSARGARYEDLGQYSGTTQATGSVWDTEEEPNLLLADAGREPDLCGVLMLGVRAAFTGGYSYLHRDVPLMYRFQACNEAKSANYVIAARRNTNVPPEFRLVRERGNYGLYQRAGRCAPPPAIFSNMLDGADDMGLGRAPIDQPDPHELRISAGSSAAAFVHGFGNGEHLECRHVRWAVGTSARMAFPLQPTATTYALSFTAQPYGQALPQAVRVSLNQRYLADFELEAGWRGYQAVIAPELLRRGRNVIDLTFARAERAQGIDTRVLAALFDQIAVAPVDTSVRVDVGTEDGRRYLGTGFSGNERNDARTFAWSVGPSSDVIVTMQDSPGPAVFQLVARAYHTLVPLRVDISVNQRPTGSVTLTGEFTRASVLLPAGVLRSGPNTVRLAYARTAKPSENDPGSTDERELAVMYDGLLLSPLPLAAHVDFGTEGAHPFQAEGFSFDEVAGERSSVWSDGPRSKLWFRGVSGGPVTCVLEVVAAAFPAALPLEVALSLNDRQVGAFKPTAAWQKHEIPLGNPGVVAGSNVLAFTYSRAVRPKDAFPSQRDTRQLAVRYDTLDVKCRSEADDVEPP